MDYTKVPQKRHVPRDRERVVPEGEGIPEDWIICNAPRPLCGDANWRGAFLGGIFYCAIDPDGQDAAMYLHRTAELDGKHLVFHSKQELIDLGLAWYKENFQRAYDEIDLGDKDHVRCLIRQALDELNDVEVPE